MTTIAYRNGIIAADTGMFGYGTYVGSCVKIGRNNNGDLAGAAGGAIESEAFVQWFVEGEKGTAPEVKPDEPGQVKCRGLIMRKTSHSLCTIYENGQSHKIQGIYFAIGTGRDIALGAMFCGHGAFSAVEAAMYHDESTSGYINTLSTDLSVDMTESHIRPALAPYVGD